ncbi:Uncharacterised protein [Mycobacterium tuberculosis]|nr:Uncharacterised protein [Mycobacterium tuberculosis]
MQHDAGQDGTHRVLANTEVQGATIPVRGVLLGGNRGRAKGVGALYRCVVAARQVGRTAPQLGQFRPERGQHRTRGRTGGQRLGPRFPVGQVGVPAVGQLLREQPVQQRLALGFTPRPGIEFELPAFVGLFAAGHQPSGVGEDVLADLERLVRIEADDLLDCGHLVVAQRRAVRLAGVHQVRRRIADDGAQRDERGPVGDRLRIGDGLLDADDVLTALNLLHVPAVRAVAGRGVLTQRDVGVVLDRDLVAVVEHDEVAQLLDRGQRRRLRGHPFFDVTVGGDDIDVVVEGAGARFGVRVEQAALVARGHRHPDRRRQSLPQRAGGDLNAGGVAELRVSGGLGSPGAQRLNVGQFQAEAAEVELDVEGQAAVPGRQNEPIAAQPVCVAGIVTHCPLKQRVGQRSQAHRRSRMTVADLLDGIGGQYPDGVDGSRIDLGPVVGMARSGKRGDLFECGHKFSPRVSKMISPHPSAGIPALAVPHIRVPIRAL